MINNTIVFMLVLYTLVVWIAFHRRFSAIYSNLISGMGRELLVSLVVATLLTALTIRYWYVVSIGVIVVGVIITVKAPSSTGALTIVIAIIIAAFSCYVGLNANKIDGSKNAEPITQEDPGVYFKENHTYSFGEFVEKGRTYVYKDDSEFRAINVYYMSSTLLTYVHIEEMFTVDGIMDSRSLEAYLANTKDTPRIYYAEDEGQLRDDFYIELLDNSSFELTYQEAGIDFSGKYVLATEKDVQTFNELFNGLLE